MSTAYQLELPQAAPAQSSTRVRRLIIESVTESGEHFRPSDWIARLASNFASFDSSRRLRYIQGITPGVCNGQRCLLVDSTLEQRQPEAFAFINDFVSRNHLRHHWVDAIG